MNNTRRGDKTVYRGFRPNRFFRESGRWYYHTREGIDEGPFSTRLEAEKHLQTHISIFDNLEYPLTAIRPGGLSNGQELKLHPVQMHWR